MAANSRLLQAIDNMAPARIRFCPRAAAVQPDAQPGQDKRKLANLRQAHTTVSAVFSGRRISNTKGNRRQGFADHDHQRDRQHLTGSVSSTAGSNNIPTDTKTAPKKSIAQRQRFIRRAVTVFRLAQHHPEKTPQRKRHIKQLGRAIRHAQRGGNHTQGKQLARARPGHPPQHLWATPAGPPPASAQ